MKQELISKINEEIKKRGMSIASLARELNMSRSHVADALSQNKASLERLIFIAEYFYNVELKLKKKS